MVAPSSCPSESRLEHLLAGTPTTAEQEQLVLHLDHCAICQRRLDDLARANPIILEAARALRGNAYVNEDSLRRILTELGSNVNLLTQYYDPDRPSVSPPRPPASVSWLGPLEDYEVTEVLGQGAMGQVLKAFDRALKRWVALKVLGPHVANDPVARLRFAREAQGAAAVRHENVITIHGVREANGLPFFVMEYIGGGSLQDHLDRGAALDWRTIARLGAEIAEGLAAAHAQGLIHRDIKPSNILLEASPEGLGIAKISDFGLVRVADESRLTVTGVIAGTPMYMAPEQVQGEALDARADLFSLGSVLYTLCTGREPFRADSPVAVIREVSQATPTPIREINLDIPPWLAAVVQRLHAKRREDRFTSAVEVAQLLRYNLDHPDHPHPVPSSPSERRARRKAVWRFAILAVAVLLLSILVLGISHFRRSPGDAKTADGQGQSSLVARAILRGHEGPILSVAFSPDGSRLATGSDDTTLRLWDPASGQQTEELTRHSGAIFAVAFAHSGKFLLSNHGDGVIHFWDVDRHQERPPLTHHNSNARRVILSPDDQTVAIGNNVQGIELWDLATLKLRKALPGHNGSILALAYAPDGDTLATGDANGTIRLLEPSSGEERANFPGDNLGVRALAFSPDSKTLAWSGSRGMDVKLRDVASREVSASLEAHDNSVLNLAFSPDGASLASGCRNGTVLIWDVSSGQTVATIPAHEGAVWSLAFSPDGRTLATVGEDRLGKLWDLHGLGALE
jgi:serine/threonine protein kinase